MIDTIINSFDIWVDAQGIKSKGRVKSVENISLVGIARLRELILELAVSGKLVAQDPNDEPASNLLTRITIERKKLIPNGKQTLESKITEKEKLFQIPNGWIWSRLGSIGIGQTGSTPKTTIPEYFNGEIPFIGPSQINSKGRLKESDKFLSEKGSEFSTIAEQGDIVMVCIGGSIGKSAIVESKITFNQQLNSIKPLFVKSTYLYIAMSSTLFQNSIKEKSSGSATPIINRTKWESIVIPLPPLAEQHRIVAKVEELMALCDKLEAEQFNNLKTHQTLVKTILETLTQATDAHELQAAWQRMSAHFDILFCTEDSIDQLKQTILQLAVMGKLVKQDTNDEPAAELLKKIEKEKEKLIREDRLKKEKELPPIKEKEIPYELPKGWVWCRFSEVGILKRGKSRHRPRNDSKLFLDGIHPFIQTGEVSQAKKNNGLITTINGYYNDFGLNQSEIQKAGTLCITIAANIAEYGFLNIDACVPDSIVCFNSVDDAISRYVGYFINISKDMLEKFAPSTAQKNINLGILSELKFPLPTLTEIHRIVAKVDELFSLCDTLQAKIQQSQSIQVLLSKTIVSNAVQ